MNDDIFWSAIKFILFPHYTNIYDLKTVLEKTKTDLDTILTKKVSPSTDIYAKLAAAALSLYRPITRGKYRSVRILREDLEALFDNVMNLLRIMIEMKKNDFAKSIIRVFLSKFFYLLTIYTIWLNPIPTHNLLFGKGKFEPGALDFLLRIPSNEAFIDMINKLGMSEEIRFLFASYALTLSTALKSAGKRGSNLMRKLEPILSKAMSTEDLLAELERIRQKDINNIHSLIYDIIYMLVAIIKQVLRDEKISAGFLKDLFAHIEPLLKASKVTFEDIIWRCLSHINSCVKSLFDESIDDAINSLKSLGLFLLKEKTTSIKLSERLLLRLHPETLVLLPALTPISINLIDEITNVSLSYFLNDLINETLGVVAELKIMLSSILILDVETIYRFFIAASKDPLASVALYFILGAPSAWLLETAITLSEGGQIKSILSNAINVLYRYMKNIYDITEHLLRNTSSILGKKIVLSNVLREFTFLAMRLNEDAISLIKKMPKGKEFMNLVGKISQILEETFGAVKIRKLDKIEDLIT